MIKKQLFKGSLLVLFFLSFYVQDRYSIFSVDDWTYAFKVQDDYFNYMSVADDDAVRQPVTSFCDALASQSVDYFKTNGRFVIHSLTQYFCGTWQMSQFAILNSLVFALFTLLIVRFTQCYSNSWKLILLLSSVWLILPHKGLTMMGNITCSIDYLWACTANLFFLLLLNAVCHKQFNRLVSTAVVAYSLLAGSLQESFSIGIAAAAVMWAIWKRKELKLSVFATIFAYTVGTCICMFTPANFRRFDDIGGMGFHTNSLLGLLSSPPLLLLIVIAIYQIRKCRMKALLESHIDFILLAAVAVSVFFALFIAYNGRHQLTAVNVFSFIAMFRISMPLFSPRKLHIVASLFLLLAIGSYYPILSVRKAYHNAYSLVVERSLQSRTGIVSGHEFEAMTTDIRRNRLLECNYVWPITFQDWDFYERSLSVYLTHGKNNKLVREVTP